MHSYLQGRKIPGDQNRHRRLGSFLTLSASFGGLEWRKKPKIFTRHCKKRPRPEAFSSSHAKRTRLVVIAEATPMPNITKLQTRQPDM
jgi:hypothetical protein